MMYTMVGGRLDGETRESKFTSYIFDYKNDDKESCRDWYIRGDDKVTMHVLWTGTIKEWNEQNMNASLRR